MIGSFWNLCRACPSMPVDKLHSEYRSTYRWHEYTGNPKPEVVRKPPVPNHFGQINEPPLPRRKKCPELAYRTHEFIGVSDEPSGSDTNATITRARSEERGTPSRRSKSEGPAGIVNGKGYENEIDDGIGDSSKQAGESNGLFKKTISKLSTEYRIQFVWPHVRKAIKNTGQTDDNVDYPRKSISLNTIKSTQSNVMPTVHKKRTTKEKEATVSELEPLVNGTETGKGDSRKIAPTRERERPNQFITKKENFGFSDESAEQKAMMNGGIGPYNEEWFKEVVELRKKAGEYKCRGWGIGIDPDLYKKQKDLWDQVSKRSSLSALSLASSIHRPITKEEKDEENNKKSYQEKPLSKARVPGQVYPIDNKSRFQAIRHHLERTTGPDVEEGALLPSPTREKLMPAIPKDKDVDSYSSQKGSPKKREASRHGSPQKGSPQKGSPKKTIKGRSQSVGPSVAEANESPKRQIRSTSTAPSATKSAKGTTGTSTPSTTERRPRPSSLSTSNQSRSKSSSLRPTSTNTGSRANNTTTSDNHHHNVVQFSQNDNNSNNKKSSSTSNNLVTHNNNNSIVSRKISNNKLNSNNKQMKHSTAMSNTTTTTATTNKTSSIYDGQNNSSSNQNQNEENKILAEYDGDSQEKDTAVSISSCSPQLAGEITEHIVKSPPEPTRVKSPEQILMRSPDPVNWTVPLDTGKTFTVTQNVKDGEFYNRPQSEVKASTPVERPPPAPQSAPPELTEQSKMEAWNLEPKDTIINDLLQQKQQGSSKSYINDDNENEPEQRNSLASDVFEIARNRFDRFWGGANNKAAAN